MENNSQKKSFNYNYLSVALIYVWAGLFLIWTPRIKDPGSRMFPLAISIFALILATILLIRTYTKSKRGKDENINFEGGKLAMLMALMLTLYVATIQLLGFYIATPFYLYLTMKVLGQKNKKTMFIVSGVMILIVYVFFDLVLGMEIPEGLLQNTIFK
jgi:hypothetical protein